MADHGPRGQEYRSIENLAPLRGTATARGYLGRSNRSTLPNEKAQRTGPPSVALMIPEAAAPGRARCGARLGVARDELRSVGQLFHNGAPIVTGDYQPLRLG